MSEASRPYNVLFLCTGNSARSLLAECALERHAKGRFCAYSAGSQPTGRPHDTAIQVLEELDFQTGGLRSKSWDEFSGPDAPELDFVFTVCDNARGEACPVWPGQPITAHWGVPDPAAFEGEAGPRRMLFLRTYRELERRIELFTELRPQALDRLVLQRRLDEIGKVSIDPD